MRRLAVKIGSNVITDQDGLPKIQLLSQLVSQISVLVDKGIQVVLVSSGAVAAGRSVIKQKSSNDTVSERQLLSSIGQVKLMNIYSDLFDQHGLKCAQVLVTSGDFKDRQHYLNIKNCFEILFKSCVVPVVNENDVVAVTELMFTDNDELAGLVASMINAQSLYLLTNVDGVYNGEPGEEGVKIISTYDESTFDIEKVSSLKKSSFGRGGIITKCHNALKISKMGIEVCIANGAASNIILDLFEKKEVGTLFKPKKTNTSSLKKWVAHSDKHSKGQVLINQGAVEKLLSDHAVSLLPIGIVTVIGHFKKGDVIKITSDQGVDIGLGKAQYGYKSALELIGMKNQKPLVHYDYLYLY